MRISVKEAARRMGVSEQYVRIGLQTGRLPIGSAVRLSGRYTYHISLDRLNQYLGVEPWLNSALDADSCTTMPATCAQDAMQKNNEDLKIEDPFWKETLENLRNL